MAIRSGKFGGVRLTGEDAKKFARQVSYGRPSLAAKETLAHGDKILDAYNRGTPMRAEKIKEPA